MQHLEKTPNEYIRWRYAIGEDRENLSKVTRKISDEELAKMQQQFKMEDGTKRVLEKLVARRKLKKQYEYEVQWKGFDPTQNTWMPRDKCAPPPCPSTTSLLHPLLFAHCNLC